MSMARFTVTLAKQDFKFSAAHFTLFGDGEAELLHGHNFHVRVDLAGERLDRQGLLVSFAAVKAAVRAVARR
jgi:6-pyruvoyltetrahydropterin/6-carboxytetrahydropterin synthase